FAAEQQPGKAIEEYRTVLKLEPDLPGIHEAIGNILLHKAKLAEALNEFEEELQIQPRSASVLTNAGQVMLMMGTDTGAAKMLTRALQMDQPPPEAHLLLGKLDLRRKDYRSAVSELTHYVSMKKDDSTAYYLLARAYRALGDKEQMDRALAVFEKTSMDAKTRSRAQKDLETFADESQSLEETAAQGRGSQ
ncbi:MAG: tetratricopeptide repeat protein, partial [Terriglobia bacterium]